VRTYAHVRHGTTHTAPRFYSGIPTHTAPGFYSWIPNLPPRWLQPNISQGAQPPKHKLRYLSRCRQVGNARFLAEAYAPLTDEVLASRRCQTSSNAAVLYTRSCLDAHPRHAHSRITSLGQGAQPPKHKLRYPSRRRHAPQPNHQSRPRCAAAEAYAPASVEVQARPTAESPVSAKVRSRRSISSGIRRGAGISCQADVSYTRSCLA
jgi:hypothetical protein